MLGFDFRQAQRVIPDFRKKNSHFAALGNLKYAESYQVLGISNPAW